jgi:heme exporter protein D
MSDWATFFAMGGYAGYVWPAYAVSIGALAALGMISWRAMKRAERLAKHGEDKASR